MREDNNQENPKIRIVREKGERTDQGTMKSFVKKWETI